MSQRRMFSPEIVATDAFIEMPATAQLLYFHLGMRADDDGFVNPNITMRMVGANADDLKVLIGKHFLLSFINGVVVVKHWRMNNFIRKDRYKPTNYLDEKATLRVKENGAYTLDENQGEQVELVEWKSDKQVRLTTGQPNDNTTVNAGKVRVGKVRVGKVTPTAKAAVVKFTAVDKKLAQLLHDLIKQNTPAWNMTGSLDKWAEDINKIIRLDGRTKEQVAYVIDWVQKDDFWRKNILSGSKLRKQFNRLVVTIQSNQTAGANKIAF